MNKKTAKKRIQNLSAEVAKHQHLYFIEAKPEISDNAFDKLFDELLVLEKEFPEFLLPDSPTKKIGSDLDNTFPEVSHDVKMLSLDKCYTIEEIVSWAKKTEKKAGQKLSFVIEEKIDGMSIELTYKNGFLTRAATRGNGITGNDITNNAATIKALPLRLTKPYNISVCGEVFIKKPDFVKLSSKDGSAYDSPRNLAAGSIRRKSSIKTAKIPLDIFIYDGIFSENTDKSDHWEMLKLLKQLGFKVNPNIKLFNDTEKEFQDFIQQAIIQRDKSIYEIDGLVIKVNEKNAKEILGSTQRYPRWAMAFKFESPETETLIENIVLQIGRLGRATPVAMLKPVKIAGATVTRATLHNQDYINELEIAIDDLVKISRRGDVIPAVERVVEKNAVGNLTWQIPEKCPSCNFSLKKQGAHHFCVNPECPEQIFAQLIHFTSKSGMDIDYLGPKTVKVFIDHNLVKYPEDIYNFDINALNGIERFADKKIALIKAGIEKSKTRPFENILSALGIKDLGTRTINILIKAGFDSADKLINLSKNMEIGINRLVQIEGIAEITAKSILSNFSNPKLIKTIKALEKAGLKLYTDNAISSLEIPQTMAGQSWCVTGSFEHFKPRDKAKNEIEKKGGKVVSSVSSKTTHLLVGKKSGTKLNKAKKLGIQIVEEQEFINMLKFEVPIS
ncbi:DNA ligase [Candidatus Magnetomoraceae bacterium gMMP-15]